MLETLQERAEDANSANRPRLIITVHGIRTFGGWQERLEQLLYREDTNRDIHVRTVKYGYFSIFAFYLPFTRYFAAWRIRKQMWRMIEARAWNSIDLVAHSFGTYLVAHSVKKLRKKHPRFRVRTIILAGSVLHPRFPWNRLLLDGDQPCVSRVVNDCGTKDKVLILSQLLVPFSSMAGRVGFQGGLGPDFRNRYFSFGHSGYFVSRGEPNNFMENWWLPLLLDDKPIVPHENTDTTAMSGLKTFLINRAEIFKQGTLAILLYYIAIVPITSLVQSEEGLRVETGRQQLKWDGQNHKRHDYRLLAALELERRDFWKDAEPIIRKELPLTPKVHAVIDLELDEHLVSFSSDARYLATVTDDETELRVREVETGRIVSSRTMDRPPKAIAVNADGTAIAAGFEGNVQWTSTNDGKVWEHPFDDSVEIEEIELSEDSEYLVTRILSDVLVRNLRDETGYSRKHPDHVTDLDFSSNGKYLVTYIYSYNDESIYLHELGKEGSSYIATRANQLDWATLALRYVLVSNDGKYVAGVNEDTLHIWDMSAAKKILQVQHGLDLTTSYTRRMLSFDSLAKEIVIASPEGAVTRWAVQSLTPIGAMHHTRIQGELFETIPLPDGRFLFAGQLDSRVVLWEETDWIGEYERLRCSAGGEFAATRYGNGQIGVFGASGFPLIAGLDAGSVKDFAVSETHQAVTILRGDGAVDVASFTDPVLESKIKSEDYRIYKLNPKYKYELHRSALSPNGEFAAFALGDRYIWVWDVYESSVVGNVFANIHPRNGLRVSDLNVSCDGQSLRVQGEYCDEDRQDCVSVNDLWQVGSATRVDGLRWDDKCPTASMTRLCGGVSYEQMPREVLVEEARRRITRNFTASEWQGYFGDESYNQIDASLP